MRKGEVVDEKGTPLSAETPCREGLLFFTTVSWNRKFRFLSRKAFFIRTAIYSGGQTPFFACHALRSISSRNPPRPLEKRLNLDHLVPIHRIDRETAGVVIFSHNPETQEPLSVLFNKRQ